MAVCWRDEVQKMQVHEANVAIDYRNAARCKSWIAGSAGEIRLCMDTSPAWWQSARSLDDKVRLALEPSASTCVCVSCAYDLRVLYICCSAPSCIQLHCHGVCALVLPED